MSNSINMDNKELAVTLGAYVGNMAGFFNGLGHPVIALISGIERIAEDRNPGIQNGRLGPYVRLGEVLASTYTAWQGIKEFSQMINNVFDNSNGHFSKALIYGASAALSAGLVYAITRKNVNSYGGIENVLAGTVEDGRDIINDGISAGSAAKNKIAEAYTERKSSKQ